MRGRHLFTLAVLSAALLFEGCDSPRKQILGKWKSESGQSASVWEFRENGSVAIDGADGRYTFGDGNRIKIQTPSATFVHQIEMKGDRMRWKDLNGTTTELARVK